MYWKLFVCLLLLFISCKENAAPSVVDDASKKRENEILNNIEIKATDVNVSRALLLNEEGATVTSTNTTEVNKPLKLRVIVNDGWVENKGKVSLGAYQKI